MTNTTTAPALDETNRVVTEHLAGKLDEATFCRFFGNMMAESARVMAREMNAGKSVQDAAGVLHGELMEFDPTGVAAKFVRENMDSLVDFMLA